MDSNGYPRDLFGEIQKHGNIVTTRSLQWLYDEVSQVPTSDFTRLKTLLWYYIGKGYGENTLDDLKVLDTTGS